MKNRYPRVHSRQPLNCSEPNLVGWFSLTLRLCSFIYPRISPLYLFINATISVALGSQV